MGKNNDLGDLSSATVLSLLSIYFMHLFFPFLLSVSVGLYMGYGYLQNSESYGNTYNLLNVVVLIIGFFGAYFQEFALPQIEIALVVGFLLAFTKLVLQVPGISMRSIVVQMQLSGAAAAVASKSVIGVLLSLVSIQSVAVFAGLGLAIIPTLILESISWLLGIRTHPVLIFAGLLSLGMVALVLDLKDRVKIMTGGVLNSGAEDSTTSKPLSTEVATEICEEMDAELPPLDDVSWSRSEIRDLTPEEFYYLCSQATERELDEEGMSAQCVEDPAPFGYGYHLIEGGSDFLEVGLAIEGSEESVDFDQIDQNVIELMNRRQIETGLIIITSNIHIGAQKQVEVLSDYGIYIGGIDFVRRQFEDQDMTPSLLEREYYKSNQMESTYTDT